MEVYCNECKWFSKGIHNGEFSYFLKEFRADLCKCPELMCYSHSYRNDALSKAKCINENLYNDCEHFELKQPNLFKKILIWWVSY